MATFRTITPACAGERAPALEPHHHEGLDLTAVAIAFCGLGSWLLPAVGYFAGWL